jgi:hypothetical protein
MLYQSGASKSGNRKLIHINDNHNKSAAIITPQARRP